MFVILKNEIKEIVDSRNVLKSLVKKNLVGRYRNSALGFGWHFVMPAIMLVVYYIVFSQIRSTPIDDFWVYLASGLFPFNYMINNLTNGSGCVVNNANMVKKMYFPRGILVLSQAISTMIIMLIGYSIVIIAIILSGYGISTSILLLPLIILLMFGFVLGYVLLLSAITVYHRDVQHFLSSISMMFFFLTPMYFVSDSISGLFKTIVMANPFTYYVEFFHTIVYYQTIPEINSILIVTCITTISLICGAIVFHKLKMNFAERL